MADDDYDATSSKNPLNQLRNYESLVKKEMHLQKTWDENWGFMRANPADTVPREFDTCVTKYYSKGVLGETEATVKIKRVPKLPENDESKYIKTLAKMQDAQPSGLMATVSQKAYQGKPSLEIFGVSEHGVAKTSKLAGGKSITKGFRYC